MVCKRVGPLERLERQELQPDGGCHGKKAYRLHPIVWDQPNITGMIWLDEELVEVLQKHDVETWSRKMEEMLMREL